MSSKPARIQGKKSVEKGGKQEGGQVGGEQAKQNPGEQNPCIEIKNGTRKKELKLKKTIKSIGTKAVERIKLNTKQYYLFQ